VKTPASPVRGSAPVSETVIRAEPTENPQRHFDGLMRQGQELYQRGWYGPAMARFRQATLVFPKSANAHLWLARAAIRAGNTAEARTALERVIVLAPETAAAREARELLEGLR
jgi:Flp pilus assembly protein TadD